MPNPREMDITRRLSNGLKVTITLSANEVETAYEKIKNLYLLNDASRHLWRHIHDNIPAVEEQRIINTYGCSVEDMCDPSSPHFALEYLADRFIQMADEDTTATETWNNIITDYLNACKTGKQEADKTACRTVSNTSAEDNPTEGQSVNEASVSPGPDTEKAPADKNLVLLIQAGNESKPERARDKVYISFNKPLGYEEFHTLETCIEMLLANASVLQTPFTEIVEFATELSKTFCKSEVAKSAGICNFGIYTVDFGEKPFWKKTVDFANSNELLGKRKAIVLMVESDSEHMTENDAAVNKAYLTFNKPLDDEDFAILREQTSLLLAKLAKQNTSTPTIRNFATAVAKQFVNIVRHKGITTFGVAADIIGIQPYYTMGVTLEDPTSNTQAHIPVNPKADAISKATVELSSKDGHEHVYITFNRPLTSWDFRALENYIDMFLRALALRKNPKMTTASLQTLAFIIVKNFLWLKQARSSGIHAFNLSSTAPNITPHWSKTVCLPWKNKGD